MYQDELGKFFYEIRISRRITIKESAHWLDISPSDLSHLEFGRVKFNKDIVSKLLDFYKLSNEEMLEFKKIYETEGEEVFYIVDEFGQGNNPVALVNSLMSPNCFNTIEEANNYYMQIRNNYPIYKLVISSFKISQEEFIKT